MKNNILLFGSVIIASCVHAQTQSGKIIYDETVKLNVNLDGEAAAFRDLIPKEQHNTKILYFTADVTICINEKKAKDIDNESEDGGVKLKIKMDMPEQIFYTNLKEGKILEQRDLMGKKFLVTGNTKTANWKITGAQKTILDMPCQQAVCIKDKDTITAWFTTSIPISSGPIGWNGLPGLILQADQNGQIFLTATKIEPGNVDKDILKEPKDGKKVSKEEFEKIAEAKRKEMQEQYGGSGNVIIKMDRREN